MSEPLNQSEQVAALLGDLRALAEKAGAFVLEQAPPLAREVVAFGRAYETALFLLLVALAIGSWWAMVKAIRALRDEDPDWAAPVVIIGGISGTVSSILTICETRDVLLVWFAPRLYLLEYVTHLLKGGCK